MITVRGKGYVRNVKEGYDESGNWYKRFYLKDEREQLILCKIINKDIISEMVENNSYVYIEDGTWIVLKTDKGNYNYIEVKKILLIDTVYQKKTQQVCENLANKMKI